MWKPSVNFITLHYAYILSFGILALIILYPYGNLAAVDAYFFGVSASTESGLNTVDVKALQTYQQVFIYITPIVTNLGFINVIVVVVRLRWFRKRFKNLVKRKPRSNITGNKDSVRNNITAPDIEEALAREATLNKPGGTDKKTSEEVAEGQTSEAPHIKFAIEPRSDTGEQAFCIPDPRERENGQPIVSLSDDEDVDAIKPSAIETRHRKHDTRALAKATSMDRAVSSIFVLGSTTSRVSQDRSSSTMPMDLASMSPEELGGIEYRALRVLLKVTAGYFFGIHLFGVICLVPWIHNANPKYRDYLASQGQDKTWWAFYSAQTMVNNLGFTLTPDSMISFRDATWPMLVMSFLAYAGNTFYPCFLRLLIWTIYKLSPAGSSLEESLDFLLTHPRRCYTLLFPSITTWTLATILFALNFLDVLLIVVLDLDNPEVNVLPVGPRILAAIFQSASSRHTGTATFNLANVNPAVQFSLLVMMYISIYPIAISIRMSSSYDDRSLGIYGGEENLDEHRSTKTYLINHMRNQLSFDLWYIFLGVFCICVAESKRIMNPDDPSFSVFAIFFEVVSAYGNVGLSLGYTTNLTSLCGHFKTFSKIVICAMMIRGRHRGLPYALDRAISLPIDREVDYSEDEGKVARMGYKMGKAHTQ